MIAAVRLPTTTTGPVPIASAPTARQRHRLRVEQGARHLYRLGARTVAEFLLQFAAENQAGDALERLLADYGRLSPELVRAAGGDRFPVRLRAIPADLGSTAAPSGLSGHHTMGTDR